MTTEKTASYTPDYAYGQLGHAAVLHAKIAKHAKVLQRILAAKQAIHGLELAETLLLDSINELAGTVDSLGKVETKAMMEEKIARHTYTLADMLREMGSEITPRFVRTRKEETVWKLVRASLVGRSVYFPSPEKWESIGYDPSADYDEEAGF